MAKNNGTPDWQKMLDYNQIDSTQKQKFLKEKLDDALDNLAQNISKSLLEASREVFRKAVDKLISREDAILEAAVTKRFGSPYAAVTAGISLDIVQDSRRPKHFVSVTNREYIAVMPDGTRIPLVSITTTHVHDEVCTEYRSYVGELNV